MIEEDKVKNYSLKKYNCKRNKGEHEYCEPIIKFDPEITYVSNTGIGTLYSHEIHKDYKYLYTTISIGLEVICIHCGHKVLSFLSNKIK